MRYKQLADGRWLVELDVEPCVAPRQTRSDKWRKRPATDRYRAFRDQLANEWREFGREFPQEGAHVLFWIPIPESYSRKRVAALVLRPHQGAMNRAQAKDLDNLVKAFLDTIFRDDDDSHVWDIRCTKLWTPGRGCIQVVLPKMPLRTTPAEGVGGFHPLPSFVFNLEGGRA